LVQAAQVHAPQIRHPALQLGLALAVSGTVGAFAAEANVDPFTTVFWRCAFGAGFLAVWCLVFGHLPDRAWKGRNVAFAGAAGVFLALCWVCLFTGFRITSIATATIVFQCYPFLLVLAGLVVWREKATLDQLLWMILAFAGVALASGLSSAPAYGGGQWITGILLTVAAAASYVGTTVLVRSIDRKSVV
jgi:drug/metabolite transporter (DMT)-like permease